jgi:catechol 2,3-dioxygenase-like lactoylglutathione lyase family enzyme
MRRALTLALALIAFATPSLAREAVTGIGGFFFRSQNPDALAKWYQTELGVLPVPASYGGQPWTQDAGPTAFAPFPPDTKFGDPSKVFMLNFRVRDLDKMVAQLRADGIAVKVDPTTYPNGRFASLKDPDGNAIQLWQPATPPANH